MGAGSAGGGGGGSSWLSSNSGNLIAAGGQALIGIANSIMASKQLSQQEKLEKLALLMSLVNVNAGPGSMALNSLQSPLSAANERGNFATKRAFLFGGPGGTPQYLRPGDPAVNAAMGTLPSFQSAAPFFTNEAMLSSEKPYWDAMSLTTGGRVKPQLAGAGYGADATGTQDALNARSSEDAAAYNARMQALLQALGVGGGGGLLGASATTTVNKPGYFSSAFQGANQGANIGGSIAPGIGHGIGAAAGALFGLLKRKFSK
jgi:hypothetical protein